MIIRRVKSKEELLAERIERRTPSVKSQRARDINAACARAKTRDKFTCLISGKRKMDGYLIDPSHLLGRNNSFPRYNPADANYIFTVQRKYHQEYELLSTEQRIEWLGKFPKLRIFAERLRYIVGERESI